MSSLVYVVIALFVASVSGQCSQSVINNVGDFILKELILNSPDLIVLPNVTGRFFYGQGLVEAHHGSLFGLYSIKRKGDIDLSVRDDAVDIDFQVTFDYIAVNYEHYKAKLLGLNTKGILDASVDSIVVSVSASMGQQSLCFLTINAIKFVEMDALNIRLTTDCKVCSKLTSYVTTSAANFFKDRLKSMIQAQMNVTLKKILKPGNSIVCKKWASNNYRTKMTDTFLN